MHATMEIDDGGDKKEKPSLARKACLCATLKELEKELQSLDDVVGALTSELERFTRPGAMEILESEIAKELSVREEKMGNKAVDFGEDTYYTRRLKDCRDRVRRLTQTLSMQAVCLD